MPSDVLQYFRQKNPELANVDDATLEQYIRERKPELAQYINGSLPRTATPLASPTVSQAVSNIPQSAANFVGGLASAITHPVNTVGGMAKVAAGGIEKLYGRENESTQAFDNLINYFKQRYGGLENIQQTIANDPVGFAADLSTVLGGAGAAVRGIGSASKIAGLAKVGQATSELGGLVDPVSAIGKMARTGYSAIPSSFGERLYGSALKLSRTLSPEERASQIATGLKEAIVPSQRGLDKLYSTIDEINNQISARIKDAAGRGGRVNVTDIVPKIDELKPFFENTIDPNGYVAELEAIKERFMNHPKAVNGIIPIDVAQQMKQNTYVLLRKAYGEMKTVGIEAQKSLARGIKDEIVNQHPEIGTLNQRESALLGLQDSIEGAIGRIANKDLIGIGPPISGGAAAAMFHKQTAGIQVAIMKAVLDNPQVKSRIAIAIARAKRIGIEPTKRSQFITPMGAILTPFNQGAGQ